MDAVVLQWFCSFLSYRTQQVILGDYYSLAKVSNCSGALNLQYRQQANLALSICVSLADFFFFDKLVRCCLGRELFSLHSCPHIDLACVSFGVRPLEEVTASLRERIRHLDDMVLCQQKKVKHMVEEVSCTVVYFG